MTETKLTDHEKRALAFLAETARGQAATYQIGRRIGEPTRKARYTMMKLCRRGLAEGIATGFAGYIYHYRITDAGRRAAAARETA